MNQVSVASLLSLGTLTSVNHTLDLLQFLLASNKIEAAIETCLKS